MSKASRRAQRQAAQEAQLKYGPQQRALVTVLNDLAGERDAGIAQAQSGARMLERSAKAAMPAVQAAYRPALQGADAASQLIARDSSALGANSALKAAVDIGQGGAKSRLAEALGRSADELTARRVDARAGGVQEARSLRAQYRSDRGKTVAQLSDLVGDAGEYASSRYGQLREDQADRGVRTAAQRESARHNRAQEDNASSRLKLDRTKEANDQDKKDKPKWATPAQQGAAQDSVQEALNSAKTLKKAGLTRSQVAQVLLAGDPKSGIKSAKPLYASVALDVAYDGHVSKRNVHELRKRRIRAGRLGYPTKAPKGPSITGSVDAGGQAGASAG